MVPLHKRAGDPIRASLRKLQMAVKEAHAPASLTAFIVLAIPRIDGPDDRRSPVPAWKHACVTRLEHRSSECDAARGSRSIGFEYVDA